MAAAPRRPALLLALALVLAAGCGERTPEPCPGTHLVTLQLHATLVSTDCVAPPSTWPWAPPSLWPSNGIPTEIPADPAATFAASWHTTSLDGVAYCSGGEHAAPLLGHRSGDHLDATRTLEGGTVLSSCASSCDPLTTVIVEGDLSGEAPSTFSGTLTERLDAGSGDCGKCVLPCTSTYTLTGGS